MIGKGDKHFSTRKKKPTNVPYTYEKLFSFTSFILRNMKIKSILKYYFSAI